MRRFLFAAALLVGAGSAQASALYGPFFTPALAAIGYAAPTVTSGFYSNVAGGVRLFTLQDRVMIGAAAGIVPGSNTFAGLPSTLQSAASYLIRDAQLGAVQTNGMIGIGAMVRCSDNTFGTSHACIGAGAFALNDYAGQTGWGGYLEYNGTTATSAGYGLEIDVKNATGVDCTPTPYGTCSNANHALWLVSGGDSSYSPIANAPSGSAIVIKSNAGTGMPWHTGVMCADGSLYGANGECIAMALSQKIDWYFTGGNVSATIRSDGSNTGHKMVQLFNDDVVQFLANNGSRDFQVGKSGVVSPVNSVLAYGAIASSTPTFEAVGTDTNVGIALVVKGSGVVSSSGEFDALKVAVTGGFSGSYWGSSNGIGFSAPAATYTDTSSSGTVATQTGVHVFGIPTVAASSATTYSSGFATVYIKGPPTAGSGATISIPRSLIVETGVTALQAGLVASGGTVSLNASSNNGTNVCTGTCNGATAIGGGSGTVAIDSSDWDISVTGAMTGIGAITADGLFTGTGGETQTGTINLNATGTGITNIGASGSTVGFFGTTAAAKQGATTDLGTALSNLGLRTAGTAYPITTSGTVNLTGTGNTLNDVTLGGTTVNISATTLQRSGNTVLMPRRFTATYDPASLTAATAREDTVTVTGVTTAGGAVAMNLPTAMPAGCVIANIYVSAADTVKVDWQNTNTVAACDVASSTAVFTQAQ